MTSRIHAQHTVFSAIFTAAALLSLFLPLGWEVRVFLGLVFLFGNGWIAGQGLLPDEPPFWRVFLGSLSLTALLMTVGSAMYYLHRLDTGSVAVVLVTCAIIAGLACAWTTQKWKKVFATPSVADTTPAQKKKWYPARMVPGIVVSAIATSMLVFGFTVLQKAATDMSIRSPWDVVPRMFFIVFFFAALAVMAAAAGGLAPRFALVPAAGLALLTVSVATLTYKVGFGFDPFIHRATESTIFRDGFINPKPLYYVGQYALVTIFAKMAGGYVTAIDAWLVPVAFALLVPVAYWSLRKAFDFPPSASAAAAVSLLLLPLSSFAATTPQGVANVIFLMTAFLALPAVTNGGFPRAVLFLFAFAAASIHPLAGIPSLIFVTLVLLLSWYERQKGMQRAGVGIATIVFALASAIAMPAVFVLNAMLSGAGVTLDADALRSPSAIIETLQAAPVLTRQFSAIYDFVYAWRAWRDGAIVLTALLGILIAMRKTKTGFVFLVSALVLAANFVLLKAVVQFPFLIAYERSNYADRLWELTLFVLAPMAVTAIAAMLARAGKQAPSVRVIFALLLVALMTSSAYLAYPRRDKYENSRGWSTNASDVEAVRSIQKDSNGATYVVLANQSVSAAAVGEFGFAKYFASKDPEHPAPIFYYPIPTGDPLYQTFLDVNEALGRRAAVQNAMDLAGVDTAYYVVSYYWWHAQEIILKARKEADASWSVNDKDYVFKYVRK